MLKETLELLSCEVSDLEDENTELRKQVEVLKNQLCYEQGIAYAYKEQNETLKKRIVEISEKYMKKVLDE